MNNMIKYFLIAFVLGIAITVAEQSVEPVIAKTSFEPPSLFGTSLFVQDDNDINTVSIIEFVNYYDQPNYTDVKKIERRKMMIESFGDKKLYAESAKVNNLSNKDNEYKLWATIDWTIERRIEIKIACVYYPEMPPSLVIDLNIDDVISVTGKYSKKELGTILLTDCTVTKQQVPRNLTITPVEEE